MIYRKPLGSWVWHCGIYKYNANKYAGTGENPSIVHLVDSKEFSLARVTGRPPKVWLAKSSAGGVRTSNPTKPPCIVCDSDGSGMEVVGLGKTWQVFASGFCNQPTGFRLTFLSALKYNPKALNYARSDVRKSAGSNYVGGLKSDSGALDFQKGGMTHSHSVKPVDGVDDVSLAQPTPQGKWVAKSGETETEYESDSKSEVKRTNQSQEFLHCRRLPGNSKNRKCFLISRWRKRKTNEGLLLSLFEWWQWVKELLSGN